MQSEPPAGISASTGLRAPFTSGLPIELAPLLFYTGHSLLFFERFFLFFLAEDAALIAFPPSESTVNLESGEAGNTRSAHEDNNNSRQEP